MARPLAVLLALAAGFFGRDHPGWGAALAAGAAWAGWVSFSLPRFRILAIPALFGIALLAWRAAAPEGFGDFEAGQPRRFRGVVAEDPTQGQVGPRMLVDLEAAAGSEPGPWQRASGRVLLQIVGGPEPTAGRGDVAVFSASLRPPWGFRNPGSGGFESYLARKGVGARASAPWPGRVLLASPGPGAPFWVRWRRDRAAAIAEAVPGQSGAVLAALTVGDRSGISRETSESFRKAGTTHLIAISGLHLGILAMLLVPPLRWLLLRFPPLAVSHPADPLSRLLALPFLTAYAAIAGFQTSTLRALAMASLAVLGGGLSRPASSLGLLCAAAAVLAAAWPPVLGDPGFQLSVAALAGLFWLSPRLLERVRGAPGVPDPLEPPPGRWARGARTAAAASVTVLCAGVSATLFTTPVSAFHFGSSSLLGLGLNPLAVPLVEFFCLPLALAGVLLDALLPGLARLLWVVAGAGISLLLQVQAWLVPQVPALSSPSLRFPSGALGAFALLVALGLASERPARLRKALIVSVAGALGLATPGLSQWLSARADPNAHLWALDVGQGQALILRLPGPEGPKWVAVDGGGFPGAEMDTGERIVVPALEALGARRLSLAISTHPHPDHVLGLASVVRLARPATLWLPKSFWGDERYGAVLEAAAGAGTAVEWIGAAGAAIRSGASEVRALWVDGPGENDRSLVLQVECGGRSALLPADVETSGQKMLVAAGFVSRCDILVAPHHGAANAVDLPFLQAASPSVAVVSAGGRKGLPSAEFLQSAAGMKARVFATFEAGCVHASFGRGGVTAGPAAR